MFQSGIVFYQLGQTMAVHLPVVIFSSLIDDQMRIKGEQLGADEQLTKPEIGKLVHVIDKLLERFERNREAGLME